MYENNMTILDLPDEILFEIVSLSNNVYNLNVTNTSFNRVIRKIDLCTTSPEKLNICLIKASNDGDIHLVKDLIREGATSYYLAGRIAIINGYINIVKFILEYSDINSNEISLLIYPSVIYSIEYDSIDIVKLILEYCNDSIFGNIAIRYAAKYGNINIVKLLLERSERSER